MESDGQNRNLAGAEQNELMRLLDHALQYGTQTDLEALFDDGMSIDQVDYSGRTALQIAVFQGRKNIVETLLSRGANVNCICMYQGRIPLTALDAANESRKTEIAQMLIARGAKTGQEIQPRNI